MVQWNIWGYFDDAMGKLETLAMGKLGSPDDLMGKLGAGPRPQIIFKQYGSIALFQTYGPKS